MQIAHFLIDFAIIPFAIFFYFWYSLVLFFRSRTPRTLTQASAVAFCTFWRFRLLSSQCELIRSPAYLQTDQSNHFNFPNFQVTTLNFKKKERFARKIANFSTFREKIIGLRCSKGFRKELQEFERENVQSSKNRLKRNFQTECCGKGQWEIARKWINSKSERVVWKSFKWLLYFWMSHHFSKVWNRNWLATGRDRTKNCENNIIETLEL